MHSFLNHFVMFCQGVRLCGTAMWIQYFLAAIIVWLFFYVARRKHWLSRKIISEFPTPKEVCREMLLSTRTCAIYGAVAFLTWIAVSKHWTRMYFHVHAYGWTWFAISIALTIFLHDAYFYWTHRLMHLPKLFPWMHRAHHRSVNPTPWTAYAFDSLEAVVQVGIFPLAAVLYPMHPLALMTFMVWQITFNVIEHSGFEIFPSWFMDSWVGNFLNTSTSHTMHHQYFRGNYGLYFNFWDRLMGTNHRLYEQRFRQVTAKRPSTSPSTSER